ncbi:MAG: putative glycoside hydrolase [Gemmatimonadota bacterium]|nr:putative glycoside hydrolase [Gemmatimonadota bacterium]
MRTFCCFGFACVLFFRVSGIVAAPGVAFAGSGSPADSTGSDTIAGRLERGTSPDFSQPGPPADSIQASEAADQVSPAIDSLPEALDTIVQPVLDLDSVRAFLELENPLALHYNGIYISGRMAAIDRKIDEFIDSSRGTPVSGFIIDMKDDRGRLSYTSQVPLATFIRANSRRLSDPAALVKKLHEHGIVACARVVAFKDPLLAAYMAEDSTYPYAVIDSVTGVPWRQDNGETWANPYNELVHDYLLDLIAELAGFGFDQVQLDYIRFPTDGQVNRCYYPVVFDSVNRADVLGLFLSKVRGLLDESGVSLSVDVFGWVPWLQRERNYWIGQDYDVIARHVDVICPMLYPSHFPRDFKAEYMEKRAYNIIREGTLKGVLRSGKRPTGVQPYIQGFKWRAPYFGSRYILDQMQAARESGALGWIVWNAASNYSALWEALRVENNEN